MECDVETGMIELKQTVFSDKIISSLRLDDGTSKGNRTFAEATPLVKY